MPGIVGIIDKGFREESKNALQKMVKCMMHEQFYGSGTYISDELGFHFGSVCHKGSFSDCSPIWNEQRDVCLLFSGEDFADQSDLDQLMAKGHEFNSESASYIVHMYEEMGIGFLERLNGVFCGVLVDLREKKCIIFNDRYGLDRIYYYEDEEGFYFSSEAKSLLNILPKLRKLDISNFGEYFSFGFVLDNKTLFSGVSLIPGGSMWTFYPGGQVKKGGYFTGDTWENQPELRGEHYFEKLKESFARIVPKYFRGPERTAVSLTGGIDTRMIMAWAPCPPLKQPCYTFGGMYRDCADVKIARQVARICQQRHETIAVNRKFFSEFSALANKTVYYTDGTMDVSGAIELYVNRIARKIAPVRITGNYGDQVVRHAIGFKPLGLHRELFDPEFARLVEVAVLNHANVSQDHGLSFFAFKQVPWCHYPRLALEQTQLTMRSPYLDNDLVAVAYRAPEDLAKSVELSLRLIADGNPALSKLATDRGMLYRPIPIATKVQHLYQEFTFKAEYAYDYGMPQWLARFDHFFARFHLERLFLGRHKFYHLRVWYKQELSKYVKDILLDSRTRSRPYLSGSSLEKMVRSHLEGHKNYTQEISWILTSEILQRQLIEKKWN